MAQINGQLTICERCGAQIFRKCTGEGETDGGFTRWNTFEPFPEGWDIVSVPRGLAPFNHVRVCPTCYEVWRKALVSSFIAGTLLDIPEKEVEV